MLKRTIVMTDAVYRYADFFGNEVVQLVMKVSTDDMGSYARQGG